MIRKRIVSLALVMMFAFGTLAMFVSPVVANVGASNEATRYQERGGTPIGGISETINYTTTAIIAEGYMNPTTPSSYDSFISCGVTAGGITVAYNDIWLTSLIPNFTPATQFLGNWSWRQPDSNVTAMYSNLNYFMGNNGSAGVTEQEYLDGLEYYVDNYSGYNITYTDVRSGNNALTSGFKTAINNGRLVSLFLTDFNIVGIAGVQHFPNSNYDAVSLTQYSGSHVMVAYGYKEIEYRNAQNQVFRTDFYVAVNTGFSTNRLIRINDYCTLDAAWVTYIY